MKHYTMREAVQAAKRVAIIRALGAVDGNVPDAAALLEIGESTLYRLLKGFKITEEEAHGCS